MRSAFKSISRHNMLTQVYSMFIYLIHVHTPQTPNQATDEYTATLSDMQILVDTSTFDQLITSAGSHAKVANNYIT